jgi:hypothetical protein
MSWGEDREGNAESAFTKLEGLPMTEAACQCSATVTSGRGGAGGIAAEYFYHQRVVRRSPDFNGMNDAWISTSMYEFLGASGR